VPPHAESNAASTASIILLCLGLDHCYPTPNSTQPPELLKPRTVTMDNAEEQRVSVSFAPPRLQKFEPSTTLAGEKKSAARLDSLIEMGINCDNMFVFANNVVDRSFDLDEEPNEDASYFAPVQSSVAPTPNSTQPPELLKPRTVTMDNAEESRASVSFGPPRLQTYDPSTILAGEEEFAARLDSLIEMEHNCDSMFVFTNNMVGRSFDHDKEDDEDESYFAEDEFIFAGEESCFALVQPSVAPTPSFTPSFTQPQQLLESCVALVQPSVAPTASFTPNSTQPQQLPQCGETSWTKRYVELQLYNGRQGDCLVPQKCKEYPKLGSWVNLQRVEYQKKQRGKKTSQMTEDRMKKLNKLGFVWDMYEAAWTIRYEELVKYKGKHGDCIVPRLHKEYPKLGEWVKNQKKEYRKKSRRMTESRIADLGVLGFEWEGARHFYWDVYEAAWTERYEELVKYKGKYGDCIVPRLYKEYPKLGEWVSTQRKLYRGKSSPEINHRVRFDKLEALGFAWSAVGKVEKTKK
jgi:hypothetical protein